MHIKISIIIPVYNSRKYIVTCLNSLLNQIINSIEFIIIDDGSTDGSAEICDEYAKNDNRFHVYHQSNQGIALARNAGLQYAHGEYIAWVDSDDYVSNNWIHSIINAIDNNHPDCLLFDYSILYTYGRQPIHFAAFSQFLTQDAYVYELSCDYRIPSYLWRQVIKRDIWLNYHFTKGIQIMEDYQAFTKLAIRMKNIYYLHELLYIYRQHVGSLTQIANLQDSLRCVVIAQERYDFFSQCGYRVSKSGVDRMLLLGLGQYYRYCKTAKVERGTTDYKYLYKKIHRQINQDFWLILKSNEFSIFIKAKLILEVMHLGRAGFYFGELCPPKIKKIIKRYMK